MDLVNTVNIKYNNIGYSFIQGIKYHYIKINIKQKYKYKNKYKYKYKNKNKNKKDVIVLNCNLYFLLIIHYQRGNKESKL